MSYEDRYFGDRRENERDERHDRSRYDGEGRHEISRDYGNYQKHDAKLSHELLGGAAAYEAASLFEKHQEAEGRPVTHSEAKKVLAGLAGAFIDREFETRGLDFIDKEKAKRHAERELDDSVDRHGY